jgi:hypothetical protein
MSVLDKLKDRKALEEELKKEGLRVVDIEDEEAPTIEIEEGDLDDPKKLAAKFNKTLATMHKNYQSKLKETAEKAKSEAVEESGKSAAEKERAEIRKFLGSHAHTDKTKNKDVLEMMDYYYSKGADLEEAYNKACKANDLEPGPAVDGDDDTKVKKKKEEKSTPKSRKSEDYDPDDELDEDEKENAKKKPLSIRDAAKEALSELEASGPERGLEDPFTE